MNLTETLTERDTQEYPHAQLGDHSWLSILPAVEPKIPLYALERTQGERSIVTIKDVQIGGAEIILMAGPCSIENEVQINETAEAAALAGAKVLRGGAFKPRTSPYSFQGLGEKGLKIQRAAADRHGLLVVTETTEESNVHIVAQYADILQIGARNSQSFGLLVKIGEVARAYKRAVLYKRGPSMSVDEWLWGAEYLLLAGCPDVILCERGSVLKDGSTGFDFDAIAKVKALTHLPIIGDPTHATKSAVNVPELARRAILAGVDGLIIEEHPEPGKALSDGPRALRPRQLIELASTFQTVAPPGRFYGSRSNIVLYDSANQA